ncbi:MAG: mechanosensitive ion channel family protein [Bryobacterales bacterium]|nr:mechanosensitive ion channel family protein [Bryobacterales bacterium]
MELWHEWNTVWQQVSSVDWMRNLAVSAIILLLFLGLRIVVSRLVMRHLHSAGERQRWLSGSRNTTVILLVLALVAVWANAIQSFILSVIALAAAFVIATKELLLCLTGSLLRAVSGAFSLGDRIQWGPVHGDVIDISLFTTTLLEVGPAPSFHMPTGRVVVVPNAKLLDTPVYSESKSGKYVVHTICIPLTLQDDLERAQQVALDAINEVCADVLEPARQWMESLEHTHNFIHTPSATPRVYFHLPEPNRVDLLLRFPSPVRRRGRMEQAILRRFLRDYHGAKNPLSVNASKEEII